jgi:selenocysteine lyase/cysteine desulfurase
MPHTIPEARAAFPSGRGYLAACTQGLPTYGVLEASRRDLDDWAAAATSPAKYDESVSSARANYARLVSVGVDRVAIGSQASAMASVVATAVSDGGEVLCVDGDFSSIVFPFLAQAHRGVTVRHAPLDRLAESIGPTTALVVFALVQSATGQIADADAILAAAAAHDTLVVCDTTQAVGWLPVDASRFDATICHAYKWLCSPRGAAFLTVNARIADRMHAIQAGWYAGDDPWKSCYGPTMSLASDARRFDVSPAWPAWPGAAAALDFFTQLDIAEVHDHAVGLGNLLFRELDLPPLDQAIVTWADADASDIAALTAVGIIASSRAGRARVAFHLWNTEDDVEAVLTALGRSRVASLEGARGR